MEKKSNPLASVLKNSLGQVILFCAAMSGLQLLSGTDLIPNSLIYALGNTLIYAIIAIGFCLLLGYAGLASLGTAGFIGVGAYIAYYLMQQLELPFIAALAATIVISLLLGVGIGLLGSFFSIKKHLKA